MEDFLTNHAKSGRLALGTHSSDHSNVEFIYLGEDAAEFTKQARLQAREYMAKMKQSRIDVGSQPVGVTIKRAPALARTIVALLKK